MVWIGRQGDESLFCQVIDDALDILTVSAHIPCEPRDRLRPLCGDDGPQDLPAGTGQAKPGHQPVSCGQQTIVEFEEVEHESGQGETGWGSLSFGHVAPHSLKGILK
jgi:hypothetical protein